MHAMRTITTVLSSIYLVSMMFALGLELGGAPKESKTQKRAKRRMLVWGLFVNLVIFPAVAYAFARAVHARGDVAIALMLLAAVPGGRFAPHLVKVGYGDVPLAIEVTLFLAKLTAFTAVPTTRLLLGVPAIELRELPLIAQLILLQIVPLYAGKWLRRKNRPLADRLLRPAQWTAVSIMVAVFFVVLFREDRGLLQLMNDRAWIAVLATGMAWPILGRLLAGRQIENRRAFAILADAREVALALVIASLAFPTPGVHTALFGIWSIYTIVTILLALWLRGMPPIKAGGPAPAGPAAARSAPAR
jgi:BASS family bile acid:Na+ symporter